MDAIRFDTLTKNLIALRTRRGVLSSFAISGDGGAVDVDVAKDAAVGGAEVVEPARLDLAAELGDHRVEGEVEEPRHRDEDRQRFRISWHIRQDT